MPFHFTTIKQKLGVEEYLAWSINDKYGIFK